MCRQARQDASKGQQVRRSEIRDRYRAEAELTCAQHMRKGRGLFSNCVIQGPARDLDAGGKGGDIRYLR
jgi:hypothetical protein